MSTRDYSPAVKRRRREAGHSSACVSRLGMSGAIAELIPQTLQLQAQVTLTSLG